MFDASGNETCGEGFLEPAPNRSVVKEGVGARGRAIG